MPHKQIPIGTEYELLRIDSEPIIEKGKPVYYWFKCRCGIRKKISIQHVKAGRIVSCGCKHKKHYHCRICHTEDKTKFSGRLKSICKKCKLINDTHRIHNSPTLKHKRSESAKKNQQKNIRNFLLRQLGRSRKNAEKRRREFNLTIDQVLLLWRNQNGVCALSRLPMSHRYNDLYSVSIDRIDSDKPYQIDNVQLVCKAINLAKLKHSNDEMKELIQAIRNIT